MSLYLGSEKVENVTAQITLPVEPSDDLPLADGTASAGVSKKFSRADHVHPMETVEASLVDLPSAEELGAIPAPTSGTAGQVLTKTASGQEWKNVPVNDETVLLKNIDITMPASANWNSICYGDGKFVAVTTGTIAAYSANGINWTQATLPTSASWRSVCYGGGKFVAVSQNNTISAYSTDGINWTQATLPTGASWVSVCYGDGEFVAVANESNIAAYSTDGINWSSTTKVLQSPNGTDIHEQVKEALNLEKEKTILLTKTDIDSMSYEDFKFLIHQFSIGYAIYYYEPTTYIMYGQSLLRATNYDDSCLYFSSLTKKYDNNMLFSTNLGIRDSNDNVLLETDYAEPIPYLKYITLKNTSDGCKVSGGGMLIDQLVTIDLLNTTNTLLLPKARKITLTTSDWSNNQQTVTCTGVSTSATSQEIRVMPADASKTSAYVSCGISCVAQASNKLTFACDTVPTTAIDVYVVMQSLNFQS